MLRLALQRTCSATQAAAVGCSSSALRALPCAASVRGFSAETGKEEREITNPAVLELADRIVQLNLLEVSDLTDLLRKRLNLPASYGMPMMAAGAVASAPAEAAPAEEPKEEKTSFDIKLEGFDAAAKIKIIKEVRAATDLGLKEAKELVEGAPVVVKKGLKKEEAEELQKKLEAVGAKIVLE